MASNRELSAQAHELAKQLGAPVRTDGMNNAALTKLVDELRARLDGGDSSPAEPVQDEAEPVDAEAVAQATADDEARAKAFEEAAAMAKASDEAKAKAAAEEAARAPAATPKATGYKVGDGKAITSMRGTLREGELVKASDLYGGQDSLDHLLASGAVVPL